MAAKKDAMVTIRLFKDQDKYKDDVFVGVNGIGYRIKRGVEVEVPESVAEVLKNSENQLEYADKVMSAEEQKSEKMMDEMADKE